MKVGELGNSAKTATELKVDVEQPNVAVVEQQ
jgi:hypothetical protein